MMEQRLNPVRLLSEFFRYGAASLAALAADISALMILSTKLHYLLASSISFVIGGIVAYYLSVKYVFNTRIIRHRQAELTIFLALGLVGLAVNAIILKVAHGNYGLHLSTSKLLAAGCTFVCNFGLRKWLLFTVDDSSPLSTVKSESELLKSIRTHTP